MGKNIEALEGIFRKSVDDLSEGVRGVGDILDDRRKDSILKQISSRMGELRSDVRNIMPDFIAEEYAGGYREGGNLLEEVVGERPDRKIKDRIHREAVDRIANDSYRDLQGAIRTAERSGIETIENTLGQVREQIGAKTVTGATREQATRAVSRAFEEGGMTSFITRDGKRLPLDFYSMVVCRTKQKEAQVQGSLNRYRENGVDLVQVTDVGTTCEICAEREGVIYSISGKDEDFPSLDDIGGSPPWHPNCIHSIRPYVKRFRSKEQIEEDKRRSQENFMKDKRSKAQERGYNKEQAIRRKANEEKKRYYELRSVLGEEAPADLASYRRMRRSRSEGWKKLQGEYRQAVAEMDEAVGARDLFPPTKPGAFKAETTKKAEKWGNENLDVGEVKYGRMDVELANEINEESQKVLDKFPSLRGFLGRLEPKSLGRNVFAQAGLDLDKQKSGNYLFDTFIQVSSRSYKVKSELQETINKTIETKFHFSGKKTNSIVSHEWGHVIEAKLIENRLGINLKGEMTAEMANRFTKMWNSKILAREVKEEALARMGLSKVGRETVETIKNSLGKYAMKNDGEFLAQAFADAMTTDNPSEISGHVLKILEEKLN